MLATARAGLPLGTVTFLFTDIEGSTELVKQLAPKTLQSRPDLLRSNPRVTRLGQSVGRLNASELRDLDAAMALVLGF